MATLSGIVDRVRLELGDQPLPFRASLAGDGETTRFELGGFPVDAASLSVLVDGVQTDAVGVEERTGVLVFDTAPTAGDPIEVTGTKYRYFSGPDLERICTPAIQQHVHNRNDPYNRALSLSNLPPVEEYPVALLATVEALYTLATDAAFDIDIYAPDGVNIPRSERYRQLMDMIQVRREQYQDLCAALNIGLYKIEVFTLRRVSRMTNKYVPVYQPQEIDDQSRPVRVRLPIPTYGNVIPATAETVGTYDLHFVQGDSYVAVVDFPFDVTGYEAKAQVRLYPEAQAVLAEFAIASVPGSPDKIEISLAPLLTAKLPPVCTWDLQLMSEPDFVQTYVKGEVFVDRQITRAPGVDTSMNDSGPYPPWLSGDAQEGFTPTTPPGN